MRKYTTCPGVLGVNTGIFTKIKIIKNDQRVLCIQLKKNIFGGVYFNKIKWGFELVNIEAYKRIEVHCSKKGDGKLIILIFISFIKYIYIKLQHPNLLDISCSTCITRARIM